MRCLQKLVRNGNSTHFTIPRPLLIHLDWLPGESIIVELVEGDQLVVRRPRANDFVRMQRTKVVSEPLPARP